MSEKDEYIEHESDFLKAAFKVLGAVEYRRVERRELEIFISGLSRHLEKLIREIDTLSSHLKKG